MEGFETPYGLELLSTVHWLATEEGLAEREQIVEAVWAWSHRKRQFTREQVGLALDHLERLGWIALRSAA